MPQKKNIPISCKIVKAKVSVSGHQPYRHRSQDWKGRESSNISRGDDYDSSHLAINFFEDIIWLGQKYQLNLMVDERGINLSLQNKKIKKS